MDVKKLVKVHIAIRDKRKQLSDEFNAADRELRENQEKLEAQMLKLMQESGMDSVRTEAGTFYRQEKIIPSASDWEALYDWIKEHDAFDALERRIKQGFIKTFMEDNDGGLPPGVSVHREFVARVRRA